MIHIEYDTKKVVENFRLTEDNHLQKMVLVRKQTNAMDNYHLGCYLVDFDGTETLQGYMYFSINSVDNSASYIGTHVNRMYRGQGIAQLLNATWISFCLENGIEKLKTSRHQRKPFLIYLLKGYSFEVSNLARYVGKSIHICKRDDDPTKYLLFESQQQRGIFEASKIYEHDDYEILDSLGDARILDRVLLNQTYCALDNGKAYSKAMSVKSKR